MKIQDNVELLKSLESIQNLAVKASRIIADLHISDLNLQNDLVAVMFKLHYIENHSKDSQEYLKREEAKC